MGRVSKAVNIDDLRKLAKRRLPRIAFDFIEGGVDDEDGIARNEAIFRNYRLVPRYMEDVTRRDLSTPLFDQRFAFPFGISPTGAISLFRPGGDLMLAAAARDANIPFVMSGHSTASIEELADCAPEHGWFQMYPARELSISEDMIRRAADSNLSTLVITVDVPVAPNRERNSRNGISRPLRIPLHAKLDALRHPAWLWNYWKHGNPMFSNWQRYAPSGSDVDAVADFAMGQTARPIGWHDIELFRRLWPRRFVLKGIMHPDDAVRAADIGADGLIISNHGGRQLDRAPSPLEVFPAIHAAVGRRTTLMLESGIRRGADIAVALCLGAKFVFAGRPTLYGTAAGGVEGAQRAIAILQRELDLVMGQLGIASIGQFNADYLLERLEVHGEKSQTVGGAGVRKHA